MATSINVSTYELLVKPIISSSDAPNRTAIEGYFLTIANPSTSNLTIELTFLALTPNFTSSDFLAFWDVGGINQEIAPVGIPSVRSYTFNLPPLDTGLFLLLPNVLDEAIVTERDTEIRGYVRLSIPTAFDNGGGIERTLLLSAQQRGTFLPQGAIVTPAVGDFDQFSYSLPVQPEVTVEAMNIIAFGIIDPALREVVLEAIENDPGLISIISSDPFAEMLSGLNADEQREMLKLFLERFNTTQQSLDNTPSLAEV